MRSLYFVFVLLLVAILTRGCFQYGKRVAVELYVVPRAYSCSLLFDNGVFMYELNKESIVKSKNDCCFKYMSKKDYVIARYYQSFSMSSKRILELLVNDKGSVNNSRFKTNPRALMLFHNGSLKPDSVFIYRDMHFKYNSGSYWMNEDFKEFFFNALPQEMKENWVDSSTIKYL